MGLLPLPADSMTVRAFIGSEVLRLPPDECERIAQVVHKDYQRQRAEDNQSSVSELAEWEQLREDFKESNRQQADHMYTKLTRIGCAVRKLSGAEDAVTSFSKEETELLAEMEHGRWNVERFRSGWRYSAIKDTNRKISPYLVRWDELPEEIKEYDREPVQNILKMLAEIGLEIYRLKR